MDLLRHYRDMFDMRRFNLLIFDECHYCSGNHVYAMIMEKFYFTTPKEDRPHILGLTASPLMNVRHKHSNEVLDDMLSKLERTLDATLLSAEAFISDDFRKAAADEQVMEYQGTATSRWLPLADNLPLHQSRFREFRQLQQLYLDLGPLATALYSSALVRELSRNEFEAESHEQHTLAVNHLKRIVQYCQQECCHSPHQGRTDKLMALEEILEAEIEQHGGADTVGLVFTDRRITAMALHNYFLWRNKKIDNGEDFDTYCWGQAGKQRRRGRNFPHVLQFGNAPVGSHETKESRNHVPNSQFEDSEDDPLLAFQKTKQPLNTDTWQTNLVTKVSPEGHNPGNIPDQFMDADEEEVSIEHDPSEDSMPVVDEKLEVGPQNECK